MDLNVVIVGHVDHGKSTLIGRLLYDSETLPEDKLAEVQKLLEEYKKRFEFAYFLDSFEEELKEERTIDTTRVIFRGKRKFYTIVDVPGHKEFIKNMLTGASHAQLAILVVSAPEGVREQTKRHSFLLNLLGIKKVIVAVNKMDLVNFDEKVFLRVKDEVSRMLSSFGIFPLSFIPISALEGDNVYKGSERMGWYGGQTLIEALDGVEVETFGEKPLRFVVQDVYRIEGQDIVVGRVESGYLVRGDELIFQPSGIKGMVRSIKVYPGEVERAETGDCIGVIIDGRPLRGDVGGRPEDPPREVHRFKGEAVILEGDLKKGEEVEIRCGTKISRGIVREIKERISSESGEVMEISPSFIDRNEAGVMVFEVDPMVVEKFLDIPELGRFVLRRGGKNIGAGIVLEKEE